MNEKEKKLSTEIKRLKREINLLKNKRIDFESVVTVKAPQRYEPEFRKAQKTVGEYFKEISISPETGTINIHNERYVLIRASSLSYEFLQAIKNLYADRSDQEAMLIGRNFLFDIAHVVGLEDAKNFHKKMGLTDPISKLSAGPVHFAYTGWAFVDLLPESHPSPDENFFLKYRHPFSFEADTWLQGTNHSDKPVCIMNAGYSSGWCEASFGIPLTAVEISCRAKGDSNCTFIMAQPDNIEAYLKEEKLETESGNISIPSFFERKRTEERLSATIEEKEILLKEVHHRVKNNLQIISSLIHLQSHQIQDDELKDQFTQCINRIRTMAIIHEMLYQAKSFNKINMRQYFGRMIESLHETLLAEEKKIKFVTEIRNIHINIDKAIPCGLIINELISNAIKYAFPKDSRGYIKTVIKRNRDHGAYKYLLIIEDNGKGIPEDINVFDTNTLGLQLINTLTQQLDGEIKHFKDKGTRFEIRF